MTQRDARLFGAVFARGPSLLAVLALGLMAGCEARSVSEPQSAAEAGRSVFGATEQESGKPAGPIVPEPIVLEVTNPDKPHSEPVVAAKPTEMRSIAANKPDSDENVAAEPTPTRAQMMARIESQGMVEPAVDPSRYPGGIVPASMNAEPLPGGPRLLVPERKFRRQGNALRVNYDDLDLLKVLNVGSPLPTDVVEMFPDWLNALDGDRIRIRGFMIPQYTTRLTGFVLARDMGACCFGPNPRIYYLISVKLEEGTEVDYIPGRPFDVVGTFHIHPIKGDDGTWFQLWSIDEATVIE